MEKEGVGTLLAMEGERPVGILTDRDIALHEDRNARVLAAMSESPVTIRADASISDVAATMGTRGLRRLPVVDADERIVGLIAADDVLRLLARELDGLAAVAAAQLPPEPAPAGEAGPPAGSPRAAAAHYATEVVSVRPDAPVRAAVTAMKERAVGCVVVAGEAGELLGVLTDRDVALRVVARGGDPDATPVSAVMSAPAFSCGASAPVEEVVETMRTKSVRRMPILSDGRIAGIVTFDDLVSALGDELHRLGETARRQVRREARRAQAERFREELGDKLQEVSTGLRKLGGDAMSAIGREVDGLRERLRKGRE